MFGRKPLFNGITECCTIPAPIVIDNELFKDLYSPVCRGHAEIFGREDNPTEQVLTVIATS